MLGAQSQHPGMPQGAGHGERAQGAGGQRQPCHIANRDREISADGVKISQLAGACLKSQLTPG